jgi:protein TonB
VPQSKEAPRAGGGPTGGRGTDVATVRTQGIDFPYPGYLNNIVRQIALNFAPPNPNSPLAAEVSFLIRRDGSVTNLRFISRSGNYVFDLEAQGAVEAAGSQRAFGPLPDGFQDDVLPVVFSFDPRFLR